MEKFRSKLIIALFLLALLAGVGVYLTIKYKSIKKQVEVASPAVSTDENNNNTSQVSQEILQLIGPPEDFDWSKTATGTDPEILKLIGPPEGFNSSTSTNVVSPEILKLIGPPDKVNNNN